MNLVETMKSLLIEALPRRKSNCPGCAGFVDIYHPMQLCEKHWEELMQEAEYAEDMSDVQGSPAFPGETGKD